MPASFWIRNAAQKFATSHGGGLIRQKPPGCLRAFGCVRPHFQAQVASRETRTSQAATILTAEHATPPTIYALSTATGRAAIAIVRVSGAACKKIYNSLCPGEAFPQARKAALRSLHEPNTPEDILDNGALVLFFPAPNTVTGEDVIEFHVHGGPAIVKSVLAAIGRCGAVGMPVQYAEPGEFTRRAFMNDRLDLTQAEALGDTLFAVTEEQRRMSVRGTSSKLADRYESWRAALLHARGELEALIDFSEDQHFDESTAELAASVAKKVTGLVDVMTLHSRNAVRGELLRNGICVSLIGRPNVGKSSILNQIVGRNAAIVSKHAGTTRDIVEVGIDLAGFFCRLGDTAGLRSADSSAVGSAIMEVIGEVEQEGIERAKAKAMESDVVILVLSIEPSLKSQGVHLELDTEVVDIARDLTRAGKRLVVVVNKMDSYGDDFAKMTEPLRQSIEESINAAGIHMLSCQQAQQSTGRIEDPGGFRQFLTGLTQQFKDMTTPVGRSGDDASPPATWEASLGATQRQRLLVDTCLNHLRSFLDQVSSANTRPHQRGGDPDFDIVLAAESLRAAADSLAKITGRGEAGDVEEVLGVVFEKFCVGK